MPRDATPVEIYGHSVLVMSLDALERAKRAAGRAKDLLDLAEIASIRARARESAGLSGTVTDWRPVHRCLRGAA